MHETRPIGACDHDKIGHVFHPYHRQLSWAASALHVFYHLNILLVFLAATMKSKFLEKSEKSWRFNWSPIIIKVVNKSTQSKKKTTKKRVLTFYRIYRVAYTYCCASDCHSRQHIFDNRTCVQAIIITWKWTKNNSNVKKKDVKKQ